jgi:hypothetical protein
LGLIKSGALGECLTRLGFEPALYEAELDEARAPPRLTGMD